MKKAEAIKYFGDTRNVANMLGVTVHAIYQWPEKVPERCQWQLALMSNLTLMPDEKMIPPGLNVEALKSGAAGESAQLSELMRLARILEQKGKGEILSALVTMAEHNL